MPVVRSERPRRRGLLIAVLVPLIAGLVGLGLWFVPRGMHREPHLPAKPQAPPDLDKYRDRFADGISAVTRGDGDDAVRHLASFDFGSRAVEEYRLYYLANGHQLKGDRKAARVTLARLWRRAPRLAYWEDAALNLGHLYTSVADWRRACDVFSAVASRSDSPAVTANARWEMVQAALATGDPSGAWIAARDIVTRSPRSAQAGDAIAIVRSLAGLPETAAVPLTVAQRLERAVALLRDGDPESALAELDAISGGDVPADLRVPVQLNRGLALAQLRRFDESDKLLDPLDSGPYRTAVPAIYTVARNDRILAASINPMVNKTVKQKVPVGKPKGKGKKAKQRYRTVTKVVPMLDLAKKAKKDEYDRRSTERLKDLLQLPVAPEIRIEVLSTLIATAEAKHQDDYEQTLVKQLVELDRWADAGLQHFWDKSWAAWTTGDLRGAEDGFDFIASTYANPNVRRQSQYWYARTVERLGEKEKAADIYRELASSPYADIYAINARARGYPAPPTQPSPLKTAKQDWRDIAERGMPEELRLAYELDALSDSRDARLEVQKNMKRTNQMWANALLADIYNGTGVERDVFYRTLRRAFPLLATPEQDSVPPYFLRMYYPLRYEDAILKNARKNDLDPFFVMAIILQESYFNPKAKSAVGATGLMQIMPATGAELGRKLHHGFSVSRLDDPDTNIEIGSYYLKHLCDLFGGNEQLAAASYNAGQGNVLKWKRGAGRKPMDELLESIPFSETRNYVKRTTMISSAYRRLYR